MRFILNMASGENLIDEPGNVFAQAEKPSHHEATMTLHAPRTRLALAESIGSTSSTASLAGIDIEALIQAIDD